MLISSLLRVNGKIGGNFGVTLIILPMWLSLVKSNAERTCSWAYNGKEQLLQDAK